MSNDECKFSYVIRTNKGDVYVMEPVELAQVRAQVRHFLQQINTAGLINQKERNRQNRICAEIVYDITHRFDEEEIIEERVWFNSNGEQVPYYKSPLYRRRRYAQGKR